MPTSPEFAAYVLEQARDARDAAVKRMFGEYGLYVDGAFVGVICDDQCFLKPTDDVRSALGDAVVEAPPYPGAKPHFVLGAELEDPERFAELLQRTAAALPPARPKKARAERESSGGR